MRAETRRRWIQLIQDAATEQDSRRFALLVREIKQIAAEIIRETQPREYVN
jgi:hypothetical protein